MKAWLLDSFNGLPKLRLDDAAPPIPADGEVLLEVIYAGLNPADRYLAEGQYPAKPPLPHILGRDGVGQVIAIGPSVQGVKIGDLRGVLRGETGVNRWGTLAQQVAVNSDSLIEIPAGWTLTQTSGAPLVYLTAWQALTQWGELKDSVVLVSGASGGVGVAVIQLAASMGNRVIGLSRNHEKSQKLRELGAAEVFDPHDVQWRRKLKDFLGEKRVNLAIDNIGGTLLPEMIDTLGDRACISIVGRLAGPVPQFNSAALLFRRIRMGGVAVGTYGRADAHAAWRDVLKTLAKSGARPIVDRIFEFTEAKAAFARLAEGPMGKVLIKIKGE